MWLLPRDSLATPRAMMLPWVLQGAALPSQTRALLPLSHPGARKAGAFRLA